MKKLKNIVIINDFDYVQGGASKVAIETANILSDEYNVIFFSGDTKNDESLNKNIKRICTEQGETLKAKNKFKGFFNGIYNFKAKKMLKELLKTLDKNETIIHIHGWTKCLSSSIFKIAWKMGFKVVLTMHDYFTACPNGGYFNYKKNEICPLKPMSFKCCKCNCDSRNICFKLYRIIRQFIQNKIVKLNENLTDVISISDFSEKILKKTLNPNTRIHRVYNPIDLDKNSKKVDYTKNKYFLYVGRISKEKGVDIFCEAISEAKQKGIVVGDGPELNKLKEKYKNIEFVGWKNSSDVKKYMKDARALIFPSRWYETMGLTVLEAINIGIPVIVSSNTAATDFIENKNNIFKNGNICSLIDIIKHNKYSVEKKKISINYQNYFSNLIKLYKEMSDNL